MKQQVTDALSRLGTNGEDISPLEDNISRQAVDARTPENTPTNDDNIVSPQVFQSLTLTKFLLAQTSYTYCHFLPAQVGRTNFELNINADSLLGRGSRMNGILQVVVPPTLCQRSLMLSHHPSISNTLVNVAYTIS